jgi:Ca2+/H+ antiporter, TMEM165/GDT1 family
VNRGKTRFAPDLSKIRSNLMHGLPKKGAVAGAKPKPRGRTYHRAAMDAFFISTGIVALAEMGDKTQLLSLVLAARFKRPWPIVWGILVATLVNHALAGAVGSWVTILLGPVALRWVLGLSFLAMAVWMLVPDKLDEEEGEQAPRMGVFMTTLVAFFLAEMGDKTQIATVMLAAQYQAWAWVVAGTTLGMMLANAPVVWLGEAITRRVPIALVHKISALIFAVLGVVALVGWA